MAWIHSPFTRNQSAGESSGSNLRKGYKVASHKDSNPDNSDTPLLFDTSSSTDQKLARSDLLGNSNQPFSKAGLSSSFFNKSGNNVKLKTQGLSSSSTESNKEQLKKPSENKNLLNCEEEKNIFEDDHDDDSEDEWCLPKSGGYHKVRSGAD